MIKIFNKLLKRDDDYTFLVSGGIDSISACHWLKNRYRLANLKVLHFNHFIQPINDHMQNAVEFFCNDFNLSLTIVKRTDINDNTENGLRQFRLNEMSKIGGNFITAHHLDDCAENAFKLAMQGKANYKPIKEKVDFVGFNIFHPFLMTEKKEFFRYSEENDLHKYVVEDPTNAQIICERNWIRNTVLPEIYKKYNFKSIVRRRYSFSFSPATN